MTPPPSAPPLAGIRVIELAGLAPGPYCGLLLSNFGASVLRIDIPSISSTSSPNPNPTTDLLSQHKSSLPLNLKHAPSRARLLSLLSQADILIDPFRPGVLESLSLPPSLLLSQNPRLILARLTGFRRDGRYAPMAGHDINYLAVSGVLSLLGRSGAPPYAPANLLADFAGGGAMLFSGILLALLARQRTGKGQVVEANMVDGVRHLATFPRLAIAAGSRVWDRERGANLLDGGCPYYDTYATRDGGYVAVGALEPRFYAALVSGLGLEDAALPAGPREDRSTWPALREVFTRTFRAKMRKEWEQIFDGTDACVTPVLSVGGGGQWGERPAVGLVDTPGVAVEGPGGLRVGDGGEALVKAWQAKL